MKVFLQLMCTLFLTAMSGCMIAPLIDPMMTVIGVTGDVIHSKECTKIRDAARKENWSNQKLQREMTLARCKQSVR
jgi:hypothetical protein